MKALLAAVVVGVSTLAGSWVAAHREDREVPGTSDTAYLLIDAATGRTIASRWDDPGRQLPLGSLIKPFVALSYAEAHGFTYPTSVCDGTASGCWLPNGHGRVGIVEATAHSCNAYFLRLAERAASRDLAATLGWFGMNPRAAVMTPAAMVGLGNEVRIAPLAMMRGYAELAARARQPGVAPIVEGLRASASVGTGRALGAMVGRGGALVKTGTAPCSHARKAAGDGYTLALYPADRPRLVLLVQVHGRTGAETAAVAGRLLREAVAVR